MISINLLPDVKKDLLRVRRERNLVVTISVIAIGVSVGVLVVLGLTLGGMTVAKMATESSIESNEKKIDDAIENNQLNRYLTVQNQLAQIDGLKGEQQIYSRLMDYLVALNPAEPNNAMLQSVTLSSTGESSSGTTTNGITITLEGSTADFASLNVYKNTLINAQISYEEESSDSSSDSDSGQDGDEDGGRNNTAENAKSVKDNLFTSVEVVDSNLSTDSSGSTVSFTIVAVFNPRAFDSTIDDSTIKIEIPRETTSDGDRNAPTANDEPGSSDEPGDSNETKANEVFRTDEAIDDSTIEGGVQ